MKYLKSYEQINEEMNWKKLAVGGALVGSLIGCTPGTPGCDTKDKTEQTINSELDVVLNKSIFDELTEDEKNIFEKFDKNGFELYDLNIDYLKKNTTKQNKEKYHEITIGRYISYEKYSLDIQEGLDKPMEIETYIKLTKKYDSFVYEYLNVSFGGDGPSRVETSFDVEPDTIPTGYSY